MNQAMKKAKETFAQGNYTCVWCRDDELLTSKEAGLRPLLTRIREGKDFTRRIKSSDARRHFYM